MDHRIADQGGGAEQDPACALTDYLLDAHKVVLGRPCGIERELIESEVAETLRLLDSPQSRLRGALTFAIEECRRRGEGLADLRFLRRFAFSDRLGVCALVQKALRGGPDPRRGPATPMGEEDLIESFHLHLKVEEGRTEHTIRSYGESIAVYRAFLAERRLRIREATRDDIIRFKEHLLDRGNCARTINSRLAAVRALYRYLLLIREIERDPAGEVRRLPEQQKKMSILSAAEVERLLEALDTDSLAGARNHLMILLLFATGGRIGEITSLRLKDLDLERRTVTFRNRKNKQDLTICLPESCIPPLRAYLETIHPDLKSRAQGGNEDLLFLSIRGNKLSRSTISRMLKRTAKLAGIEKHVSPHTFRRSVATIMANGGMSAEMIRNFLGHQSVDTTLRNYVAYSEASQRRAVEQFHPLSEQELATQLKQKDS